MAQSFYILIGSLYALFAFIVILFSLTVIIIVIYYWRTKCRSTANLLCCHSAVTILFYSISMLIQVPFVIQTDPAHPDEMNTVFCKTRAFIHTYATLVKAYSYLTMAISCFFTTVLYKHRSLLSYRANLIVILLCWIGSGIITTGTFLVPSAYEYEIESGLCFLTTKHFATSFSVVTLVVMVNLGVMITLYGFIIRHITHASKINANSVSILRAKRNMKVFKKISLFVCILTIGGTPYFICSILHYVNLAPWPLYSIVHLFVVLSAALESMALFFTNKQMRTIVTDLLRRRQINGPSISEPTAANKITPLTFYPQVKHSNQTLTQVN